MMRQSKLGVIVAALASAAAPAAAAATETKCPAFPDIGSKYGSDGGSLFDSAFAKTVYPIEALPKCEPCKGQEGVERYKGALASKLKGIDGHLLQVFTSTGDPGYTSGNKVVRVLYANDGKSANPLIKIREYTFQNDGGYYRRSRFFKFSCPGAFTEVLTTETAANSKASYGLKLVRVFSSSDKTKEYKMESQTFFNQKPALTWIMSGVHSGSEPWLASSDGKNDQKYQLAGDSTVVSMQSGGLSQKSPLTVEYFFSTYPVKWKAGPVTLPLQEDLMESVVTVDISQIHSLTLAVQDDAVLQLVYEVYTGSQAGLKWIDETKVLEVTPMDTTKSPLPELTEFYKFDAFVICIPTTGTNKRLKFTKLTANLPQSGKPLNGVVAITGEVAGIAGCKQVVWDPTNGELKPTVEEVEEPGQKTPINKRPTTSAPVSGAETASGAVSANQVPAIAMVASFGAVLWNSVV